MNFDDTPEEATFRAECRAWLAANAERRRPDEAEEPATIAGIVAAAKAWQARKFDAGWACLTWPREYGGRGASAIQKVIWNQEEARFRVPPPGLFVVGIEMAAPTIMAHGSTEQKARFLPSLGRGEEIWCQLFSEPGAGSDLAGIRTRAVRTGDTWIVNGQKIWTSGAQIADWGILLARTDPTVSKHAGLTYFLVDMHAPGIEVRPIREINGATNFNEVFFTDVRIALHDHLAAPGEGWKVALTTLMNERTALGGGSGAGWDDLARLAREVVVDGRPAIEDPAVRQRLAEFYVRAQGLRYTHCRTLTALSRGETPGPEASIGKLVGASLGQEMAAFALDLEGRAGALAEGAPHGSRWQETFLTSPGLRIAGGTDEIMRTIVAERVLGLPPEARADKGIAFQDVPTGPTGG